jgi:putative ABC transport system permease protein
MKWGGIRAGVRRLFRLGVRTPERIRADADEELRSYIDARIEHLAARGMSPDQARIEAERRLGGTVDDVRVALEESALRREKRMELGERFDWILQDIGVAIRGLRNAPGFTATVVLTLALGVGVNAAVFSVLDRIYLQEPAGVAKPVEVRRVYERLPANAPMNGSHELAFADQFDYPTFVAMRAELDGRAALAAFTPSDSESIGRGERAIPARVAYVSANYLAVLGVGAARGRFFASSEGTVESDPGVAVIGHALWDRAFGRDPGVVGRKVEVNKRSYVVIGVAANGFAGTDLSQAELFLPLGAFDAPVNNGKPWYKSGIATYFRMVARVPNGDDRQLDAIATIVNRRFNSDMRGQLPPGTKSDTSSTVVTGPIIAALGPGNNPKEYAIGLRLAAVAAIVLLIACANIANLLLVRAIQRRHEVAVRLALGVSRTRLIAQFLTEGVLLSALGGAAAILLAAWGGTALRRTMLPTTHWAASALNLDGLAFTLAIALLTGVAAALLPALQGSQVDIVKSLKPGSRGHERTGSRVRSTLLATQTALSLVLLVGAGLFVRSLQKLHDLPIGYAADELAFASVRFDDFASHRAERIAALPRAAERIASAPGVVGVALADHAPMLGGSAMKLWVPGADTTLGAYYNSVSPEFFTVAGVRILAGRALTADDRRDPGGAVVVNATMAKQVWPRESPFGKCIILGKSTAACSTVVGIAEDSRMRSILESKPSAQYFLPLRSAVDSESVAPRTILVRTRAGGWFAADAIARSELRRLVPTAEAVSFNPMTTYLEPQLRPWRLGATLFTAFGLLALVVATIGVHGVIAYSFSQRTHELGVRTALGASVRDTYELVLGEALRLTAIGVAVGVLLALGLGRLVASLLYATSARDPLVIAIAASVLVGAGTAASLVPAWRAARTDPMIALRAE